MSDVRVGLLGLGQMGRNHLRILSMMRSVETAFVHDADLDHARAVAAQYHVPAVDDVDAAVGFYTKLLGFRVEQHPAPGFASLSRGGLNLLLNAPGAGGAGQPMPDGRRPAPGGWNRIRIGVGDLAKEVETLRQAKARFRNDIVVGNGGRQILLEDPSGNPIELFQPAG